MVQILPHLPSALFLGGILLAAAVGAAETTLHADLTATSLTANGSVQLNGQLIAFLQDTLAGQVGASDTGGASANFTLQARSLRMETDHSEFSTHLTGRPTRAMYNTANETYANATVEGLVNREGYAWNLFSTDPSKPAHIEVSNSCMRLDPSQVESISRLPHVDNVHRPATTRDTSHALQLGGCLEGATVRVTGDVVLSLWKWNATLTAGGTTQTLHTGHEQSSRLPAGAPNLSEIVSEDQEIYLYATNATLTVPIFTGDGYTLLTGSETRISATGLEMQGATGQFTLAGQTRSLQDSSFKFTGQTQITLFGTGAQKPFTVQLTGSPTAIILDGQALAIITPAPLAGFPWGWLIGGVGLVVVAVPLARRLRAARMQRLLGLFQQGFHRFAQGQTKDAEAVAAKILDLDSQNPHGHYLKGLCRSHAQDYEQAMHHHQAAERALFPDKADVKLLANNALQAALTLAWWSGSSPQRRQEILMWLKQAFEADSSLEEEAAGYPELRVYLRPEPPRNDPAYR